MATGIPSLVTIVRGHLNEATAKFWSDSELIALMTLGARDLWKAINDNYQDYFLTINESGSVSLPAEATTLSGIPNDVARIHLIEAIDQDEFNNVTFVPKRYDHPDFCAARAQPPVESSMQMIYYHVSQAGAPVGAPTIDVAPKVRTAIPLRLVYVPTIEDLTTASTNPIPGEADNALVAWTVAFARAKEREDRSPDAAWLAIYGNEKQNTLVALTPRQVQEPDTVEGLFDEYWQ
jgi:hypothetical protein